MTPREHNKTLGILHLVYGGLNSLGLLAGGLFIFLGGMAGAFDPLAGEVVFAVSGIFVALFLLLFLLLGLPSLIAGYGILQMKKWARTAGIVSGALSAINFPFGSALCIYTLWFLFNEGRELYEDPRELEARWQERSLGGGSYASAWSESRSTKRQEEYVPPAQPPSWHD